MITRKRTAAAGTVIVAALAAVYGYFYFIQDSLVYHPYKEIRATPDDIGLLYEDIALETADGVKITGWYVPAWPTRGVVLFFHGNGGNISHRLESLRIFNQLDMDVLIVDYRGYGNSEGKPGEEGTYRDAEASWDYLVKTRGVPPGKIIVFGRSLGGAVAAELALRHPDAAGLVIESGFTSVADMGKEFYPYLPVGLIVRHKYATIDKIGRIDMPKLIVHSPGDEIVPYAHGVALYGRAAEPKAFLEITGGHNDGFIQSQRHYTEGLSLFITDCLGEDGDN